ncbi:MAG: penicillin-binding protein 2 [Spirochaetes bacterium]|nr:penicillin-binding protein 2 [Spirochaetota bacterium]
MQNYSIRPGQKAVFRKRVTSFLSICLFTILVLLFRIAYLQIIMADMYSNRADANRVRRLPIIPNRGKVYDRHYKIPLIINKKSLCITVVPVSLPKVKTDAEKRRKLIERLSVILQMSTNDIVKRIENDKGDIYTPVVIKENVDFATITKIAEDIGDFPGVYWENRPARIYTMTNTLSHLLGYTGSISRSELRLFSKRGYRPGSVIGKTGIERIYDLDLRGEEGILEREVNARNHVTYQKIRKRQVNGRSLVLAIDRNIQHIAQTAMGKNRGAVIVSKPATGEILALLSNPGYNANLFYGRINEKEFSKINKDINKPLFNRSIQAVYPPSSIFKLVTATAALEQGFSPTKTYYCDGGFMCGNRYFKCWFGHHGRQNMTLGIINSCNVYFYKLSLEIKPKAATILRYAKMYGFGKKTGIDLLGESRGFVPTMKWKKKQAGRPWLDGDTLNLAIGQGDLLVTPIQMNTFTSSIYNNGIAYKPYILKEVRSIKENKVLMRNRGKQSLFTTDISQKTFRLLKSGMRQVVSWGTGRAAFSPKVVVAGKTGTAQNTRGKSHAWFTCYAPANAKNPEDVISITVICENAGGGGAIAAPIAACIIRAHFENKTIQETMQYIWKQWAAASKKDKKKKQSN